MKLQLWQGRGGKGSWEGKGSCFLWWVVWDCRDSPTSSTLSITDNTEWTDHTSWNYLKSISLSQVIAAEGEQKVGKNFSRFSFIFKKIFGLQASRALRAASDVITESSAALQLRYLQVAFSREKEGRTCCVFLSIFEVPTDKFEKVLTSYILRFLNGSISFSNIIHSFELNNTIK